MPDKIRAKNKTIYPDYLPLIILLFKTLEKSGAFDKGL